MSVDPLYLQHKHAQKAVDYRVGRGDLFSEVDIIVFLLALGRRIKPSISCIETLVHISKLWN